MSLALKFDHKSTGRALVEKLLHTEVWTQPLGEAPVPPEHSVFIAKAFEIAGMGGKVK